MHPMADLEKIQFASLHLKETSYDWEHHYDLYIQEGIDDEILCLYNFSSLVLDMCDKKTSDDHYIELRNLHHNRQESFDDYIRNFRRKIDREREINSIVDERPQAREVAQKCSCCPLFLEVVGAYIHKRHNKIEAYENVFCSLREGESFICYKEDRFDESRILFAYHELQPSALKAFLDICSFFSNWEWDKVACIVGEEELECLHEGALLKRIEVQELYEWSERKVWRISIHNLILTAARNKSKGDRFRNAADFYKSLESEE
ncbi:hypothetical protein KI387_025281, partial [Taxus chinensis]